MIKGRVARENFRSEPNVKKSLQRSTLRLLGVHDDLVEFVLADDNLKRIRQQDLAVLERL